VWFTALTAGIVEFRKEMNLLKIRPTSKVSVAAGMLFGALMLSQD
jgi:hypothetical protein